MKFGTGRVFRGYFDAVLLERILVRLVGSVSRKGPL